MYENNPIVNINLLFAVIENANDVENNQALCWVHKSKKKVAEDKN